MVRPIRFSLKELVAADMENAAAGLGTPKLALANGIFEGRYGHETVIHRLKRLTATFEDEADRQTLFVVFG